jgi:hypothetical protein
MGWTNVQAYDPAKANSLTASENLTLLVDVFERAFTMRPVNV